MVWGVVKALVGAVALGVAGWQLGELISSRTSDEAGYIPWGLAFTLGGVLLGALAMPFAVFKPLGKALNTLNQIPASTLMAATGGLVVGLVIAVLISIPLINLEGWLGWGIPLIISFSLGALGLWLGAQREAAVRGVMPRGALGSPAGASANGRILVDTSAIIDGRLADISETGFLQGTLIIPGFVLDELRHIADSSDSMRRTRGRRGLEVLGRLRKDAGIPLQILDVDIANGVEVDRQLVKLAKSMKATILTTDFNLNRVADVQGIKVLNVNELANALKPLVLPGEELAVNIVQEGKEVGQGVGFLDDGTMIVVEGGRRYLNSLQEVAVIRILQTSAGRIIFAQPKTR